MQPRYLSSLLMAGIISLISILSCTNGNPDNSKEKLAVVSFKQFDEFVSETGYVTDAEKYGWSIVQKDVYNYTKVDGANWRKPDGINKPYSEDLPVTQVSYNDAMAYCEWSGTRLPTYDQYWELIDEDGREIITNNTAPVSKVSDVNILGNVWEITGTVRGNEVRLAGGSIYCSTDTCHGTSKERDLYVDKETGNLHIGFAVLMKSSR